jgi:putative ABC transport system substrate-binding protein
MMRRREFVTLIAAAATWPQVARALEPASPIIGFLGEAPPELMASRVAAFHRGLGEVGYVEDRNVTIDWRSAERQPNRLPALAADLIARRVAIIVTTSDPATIAAETATAAVPIVFLSAGDPVRNGLAATAERPRGNVTGLSWSGADLAPARLALLHQLVPKATVIGLMVEATPAGAASVAAVQAAAAASGLTLVVARAGNTGDIEAAYATLLAQQVGGVVVGTSAFLISQRQQLIGLAARHSIPAIYPADEMAVDGGLASYGYSASDAFRRAGVYTGWILEGARPADLPVLQSSKIELIVNLKTAAALGLEVPPNLLAGADEVIR